MPLHADAIQMSKLVGSSINRGGAISILTDAGVAANNASVAVLSAYINGVVVPSDQQNYKRRIIQALGADAGITDTAVQGVSTVAGLAALTSIGSLPNLDLYGD